MTDEQHLLASAYLDGDLPTEERARAEADPEVMEAVAHLRELRRAVAAVEPPDPTRREAAIRAALEVFDAEAEPVAPPPVMSLARHRLRSWLVPAAAAAALVLVVAGGLLAVRGGDDGDDDDAAGGGATAGTTEVLSRDEALAPAVATEQRDSDESAEDAGTEGATETTAAAAAATTGAPGSAPGDGTMSTMTAPELLTSPDDLTAFAANSLRIGRAVGGEDTGPTCDEGQWLGRATYAVAGVETPVEVFLAEEASEVRAVDPADCTVVATAPAP